MTTAPAAPSASAGTPTPSPSQRAAIEAAPGPLVVLAGPGAGKTFCLTERIQHLITHYNFDPSRILAFTFTNRAAGEIAHRLAARLGDDIAERITRGTIHAFCAQLLREHSEHAGLAPGFGIADEAYQLSVLRRLEGPRDWHRGTLSRFSRYRFSGVMDHHDDLALLERYERYLAQRNVVDFDTLVLRAADLLENSAVAAAIRARWDVVLVDEFQDLNAVQYRVVLALAREHRHVFAVGDDEQSIYSWAGAEPRVFRTFVNDFGVVNEERQLLENRRCPRDVFALARRLITVNPPLFSNRHDQHAVRTSAFAIRALSFATDDDEAGWIVKDLREDREQHGHRWGECALLYRKHDIGDRLEAALLNAGIPCELPRGRALSDDPVVAYVIAAARVISSPRDDTVREGFFATVLPRSLLDEAAARALESGSTLQSQLNHMAAQRPRGDESARQMRRALYDARNLIAVGRQHTSLHGLALTG
jgi:superfamily I DNA/RNA helicase